MKGGREWENEGKGSGGRGKKGNVGFFSFLLRSNGGGREAGRGRYRREEDINVKYIPYSMP